MQFFRSVLSVSVFTVLGRVTGYAREVLMSSLCGASAMSDALLVAIKIPSFLRRIFAEGAFHASFVPQYTHSKKPTYFAGQILSILLLVSGSLVVGVVCYYPTVIKGLGYLPQETLDHIRVYGPLCFPYVFFISMVAFYGGILNAHGRFVAFSVSSAIGNLIVVGVVSTCWYLFPTMVDKGQWFAWGGLLSGIVQMVVMLVYCRSIGFWVPLQCPSLSGDVRQFFQRFGPGFCSVAGTQINILLVPLLFASRLPEGSISYLHYADRLIQLPLSIIGIAFSSVLLPFFTQHLRDSGRDQTDRLLEQSVIIALLLTIPLAVLLTQLSLPVVDVLYGFGKMNSAQLFKVAHTIKVYALGLPAFVCIKIFTARLNAARDTLSPFFVGLAGIVCDLAVIFGLIQWLDHLAIAWGSVTAAWVTALLLLGCIGRGSGGRLLKAVAPFVAKSVVAAVVMGIMVYAWGLLWLGDCGGWCRAGKLMVMMAASVVCYGVGLVVLRVVPWSNIRQFLVKES